MVFLCTAGSKDLGGTINLGFALKTVKIVNKEYFFEKKSSFLPTLSWITIYIAELLSVDRRGSKYSIFGSTMYPH